MTPAFTIVSAEAAARTPSPARATVRAIAGKGRGIVAAGPIAAGDLILTDPTVELSAADCRALGPTPIEDYHFAHPEDAELGLLVLGLASLANHADAPNAATEYCRADGLGWLVMLRALRAIAAGEEITRRYACEPWFPVT
ncbi:MAG: SET domain-containing protein-lysine N-methyltransferase [Alphaproteobacteria bacterium]|nr:SET domain-containing protein-lysine N-methyltransferase [Alphaproteobacteria bacterium]MCB9930957.1 SET domain-containing protein-lysine N-methyltransferase [Alphaproteobacteria bacterium]